MSEQQVKIGPEFFRKIKLDYADWRWALVREFLQNCFDAPGCHNVELNIVTDGTTTTMTVSNDGKPMDRDTLTNKLLTLGGSGKNFEGENTGGFGVAKSLLYYCHAGYVISTGSLLVRGKGAQYTIFEQSEVIGTTSIITLEGNEANLILDLAEKFASMAQWRGTLVVNGKTLQTNLHKGTRRKDLGWATVYTNKSAENLCIVRLNGQPMFSCWTQYKGCVLLELTGKACATLTSNRDGLVRPYSSELNDLLTALAVDKRSALREQRAEYKRYAGELQRNEAKQPKAVEDGLASVVDVGQIAALVGGSQEVASADVIGERPVPASVGGIKVVAVDREDVKTISVGPQFILKNTTGKKAPVHYVPGEKFCKTAKGLVRAWTALLLKLHQLCNVGDEFSIGFVFDEESEAEYERSNAYGKVYYLNPIKMASNEARRMEARFESAWKDRHQLISLACHEFVHGAFNLGEHDEDYASRLTDVMTVALKAVEELTDLCRPVVDVKDGPPALARAFGSQYTVFGQSSTAVVRWMVLKGWNFSDVKSVIHAMGAPLTDSTIRNNFAYAQKNQLPPAVLTEDQVQELENLR